MTRMDDDRRTRIPRESHLTQRQMDQFPWDGATRYLTEHSEILPRFKLTAVKIVDDFEEGRRNHDRGNVLVWGPSGIGKSSNLLPLIDRELAKRGYYTTPPYDPEDLPERALARIPKDKPKVFVLDEFCNAILQFKPLGMSDEEFMVNEGQKLALEVEAAQPVGLICVDARSIQESNIPEKLAHKAATRKALAAAIGVSITEWDIPLEEIAPEVGAVAVLYQRLGFDPELIDRLTSKPELRNLEFISDLIRVMVHERMNTGGVLTSGDEIVTPTLFVRLLLELSRSYKTDHAPWYGFGSLENFKKAIKG